MAGRGRGVALLTLLLAGSPVLGLGDEECCSIKEITSDNPALAGTYILGWNSTSIGFQKTLGSQLIVMIKFGDKKLSKKRSENW